MFVIFFYLAQPDAAAALRGQSICSENRRCSIPLANVFDFCNPCVISTIMPCHGVAKPDEPEVQGPDELENAISRIGDSDRIDCTGLGWTDGGRAASPADGSAYAANA
jgi:hypothetical protein